MKKTITIFLIILFVCSLSLTARPMRSSRYGFGMGGGIGFLEADMSDYSFPMNVTYSGELTLLPQEERWNLVLHFDVTILSRDGAFGWSWSGSKASFIFSSSLLLRFTPLSEGFTLSAGPSFRYRMGSDGGAEGAIQVEPSFYMPLEDSGGLRFSLPVNFPIHNGNGKFSISFAIIYYLK